MTATAKKAANDVVLAALAKVPGIEEQRAHDTLEAQRLLAAGDDAGALRLLQAMQVPAGVSGFQFLSADEMDEPQGEPDWVVKGLGICPGRPAGGIGPGSSGKSTLFMALLAHVTVGARFLGQFHCPQAEVVHLDFEMGRRATLRKLRRLCKGHGLDWREVMRGYRLAIYPRTFLNSPECEEELTKAVQGRRLCLVDSLRRSLPGIDENDSRIADHLQMLARVSDATSCAFVMVHHDTTKMDQGKARDRRSAGRGSSAIFDGSGSYIVLDGKEGTPPRVTHVREPQEGRMFDPFHIRIEDVAEGGDEKAGLRVVYMTPEQVEEPQSPAVLFRQRCEAVMRVVRANPGIAGSAAVYELIGGDVGEKSVRACTRQLLDDGRLQDRGTKSSSGRSVRLFVTDGF